VRRVWFEPKDTFGSEFIDLAPSNGLCLVILKRLKTSAWVVGEGEPKPGKPTGGTIIIGSGN